MHLLSSALLLTLLSLTAAHPTLLHPRQSNLQPFTGALGGISATPILDSGNADRPFSVKGDTFTNLSAALQRSCDQQFNACANAVNGGNADGAVQMQGCVGQKGKLIFLSFGSKGF